MQSSSRSDILAVLGLLIAVISCLVGIAIPEIRGLLGLSSELVDPPTTVVKEVEPQLQENDPVLPAPRQEAPPREDVPRLALDQVDEPPESVGATAMGSITADVQEEAPQRNRPLQGRVKKPLAGAFIKLFYFAEQSDDAIEVMSGLAGFGATVELQELDPDQSYESTGASIRESPCWKIAGKELEEVLQGFSAARLQTSEDSCDLDSLGLILTPDREDL